MNRPTPYLTVLHQEGKDQLRLEWDDQHTVFFDLTEGDCLRVGRKLYEAGVASWLWGCRQTEDVSIEQGGYLSVEELVGQGWNEAMAEALTRRRKAKDRLFNKLLGLVTEEFRAGLPEDEREALKRLEA